MANVSWNFYRSRRRIDIHALVSSGRVIDYSTYLSYCSGIRVVPASQQDFDLEFGSALSKNLNVQAPIQAEMPPPAAAQSDGLEATVWLAGIEGDTASSAAPTLSKSKKKKKSKEDIQE